MVRESETLHLESFKCNAHATPWPEKARFDAPLYPKIFAPLYPQLGAIACGVIQMQYACDLMVRESETLHLESFKCNAHATPWPEKARFAAPLYPKIFAPLYPQLGGSGAYLRADSQNGLLKHTKKSANGIIRTPSL
jgi:hypothetical protein